MLECLALAYAARAAGVRARLAGSIADALRLESQSTSNLDRARTIAGVDNVDIDFDELARLRTRASPQRSKR
ncbi:MAG: hypothetical protein Q8O67_22685 [Deltaproteobacteria bacterium]|nr:hypothetical protein [Deltaproteobacteria bacterium]